MSSLPNPKEFKNFKATLKPSQYSSTKTESIPLEQVAEEFNSFEPLTIAHKQHLTALFPEWLYNQANEADMAYFGYMVRFDKGVGSLVAAVIENNILDAGIVSYKHRLKGGVKWRTRAGTHPNNTVMYRVYDDSQPVIVVEGIRDFMAGVLLGFNVIGIPTASYKGSIDTREDEEVIFFIEDDKAYPVMMRLSKECLGSVRYRLPDKEKKDLSDLCFECESVEEVMSELTRSATN